MVVPFQTFIRDQKKHFDHYSIRDSKNDQIKVFVPNFGPRARPTKADVARCDTDADPTQRRLLFSWSLSSSAPAAVNAGKSTTMPKGMNGAPCARMLSCRRIEGSKASHEMLSCRRKQSKSCTQSMHYQATHDARCPMSDRHSFRKPPW